MNEGEALDLGSATRVSSVGVIDSVASAYDCLGAVLRSTGTNGSQWDRVRFLRDWSNLTESRKMKLLEEFGCYETFVFVKRKDPQFYYARCVLPEGGTALHISRGLPSRS